MLVDNVGLFIAWGEIIFSGKESSRMLYLFLPYPVPQNHRLLGLRQAPPAPPRSLEFTFYNVKAESVIDDLAPGSLSQGQPSRASVTGITRPLYLFSPGLLFLSQEDNTS